MTTRRGARFRAFRRVSRARGGAVRARPHAERDRSPPAQPGAALTAVGGPATISATRWSRSAGSGFRPTPRRRHLRRRDHAVPARIRGRCTNDCNTAETFPYDLDGQPAGRHDRQGRHRQRVHGHHDHGPPALARVQRDARRARCCVYETTRRTASTRAGCRPARRGARAAHFARNSADCPPVQQYDFSVETEASATAGALQLGRRTSAPASTRSRWTSRTRRRTRPAKTSSRARSTSAVTSLPPEPGEITADVADSSRWRRSTSPAVAIAYNITDSDTDKQITDLTLTPRLVARLLSDSDLASFFQDPEFLKLNPHHSWPIEAADPGLRGEKNADTWIVTQLGRAASPGARPFLDGKDKYARAA